MEIRYAGVVVASATEILRAPGNDSGMFLVTPEPLPVGTVVDLADGTRGRVEKVVESPDPRGAGMYVRLLSEDEAAGPWVPQLPEKIPLPAPRRIPTPPGVPLVSPRVAEARPTLGENGERRPTIVGPVPPPVAHERPASIVLANPERAPAITAPTAPPDTAPPPAAALADSRERRNTIVMSVPPAGSHLDDAPGAGGKVSGEFQSRAPASAAAPRHETQPAPATIVIAADEEEGPRDENMVQAPLVTAPSEEGPSGENSGSPEELLQPARPLPPPDGRRKTARRRRNTR